MEHTVNFGILLNFLQYILIGKVISMDEIRANKKHELNISSRNKLTATGISKIRFFSSETVAAESSDGLLIIKGEGLFVESLDSKEGILLVKGKINSASYGEFKDSKSFWGRLIK